MAVEAKRGCGYRKVGGTYLVSSGEGMPCDRLPIRLDVCPVCSHGFKQARGWTWVDLFGLVGGNHVVTGIQACDDPPYCPLCHNVKAIGKAGLLWIGEKFYKTPEDFMREGRELGFSRRVHALPRGFKVGETWVLLAHPKADRSCDYVNPEENPEEAKQLVLENGILWRYFPAIFTVWRPTRVEKILKESQRDSEEVKELLEKGITPVFVPDDDPDHQGTVYDKEEETEDVAT
jgi:hypothetical protein